MMVIRQRTGSAIEFAEIEPLEQELLWQIVSVFEAPPDPSVEDRLFSAPANETETEFLSDWSDYVQPELRRLFLSARTLVKEDLGALQQGKGRRSRLKFPVEHGEAWLNTLNQARLALAARFHFTEAELSSHKLPRAFTKRDLVLVQINFYAAIQERIIDILEAQA
jgi:Domain of unknown function (DUF2017)